MKKAVVYKKLCVACGCCITACCLLRYLALGFFNILLAWIGLICFFTPLMIAIIGGNKAYCNKYCGRAKIFSLFGGRFGLSRKKDVPK
ncbi:MAG: hypothetical protein E7652_02705 [Ruminococcaceae bacterium]|nr:hypothetical protein [Oscillospiraceae bacterium]